VREGPAPQPDRALAALSANLLVLPGLGSIAMGRRSGWLQAAIALGGFVLTLVWIVGFVRLWIHEGAPPLSPPYRLGLALDGVGLFALAWLWALATGWSDVRRARAAQGREPRG
jgi:hypothetical protein